MMKTVIAVIRYSDRIVLITRDGAKHTFVL
jgi:hypothetical protein